MTGIERERIPRHVAIVMDGNGRWARRQGLKRTDGHAAGEEALFDTVEGALDIGLPWLTVFAFSTENWRRPLDEVQFLMRFNESLLLRRRDDLDQRAAYDYTKTVMTMNALAGDAQEGIGAFLQKRQPRWTGRQSRTED